jgi:hypothetical protein
MADATTTTEQGNSELVKANDLSKHVGMKVSEAQWRKWTRQGSIPHLKIGQTTWYNPPAVRRWLAQKASHIRPFDESPVASSN